jgi:hypothetical protein
MPLIGLRPREFREHVVLIGCPQEVTNPLGKGIAIASDEATCPL